MLLCCGAHAVPQPVSFFGAFTYRKVTACVKIGDSIWPDPFQPRLCAHRPLFINLLIDLFLSLRQSLSRRTARIALSKSHDVKSRKDFLNKITRRCCSPAYNIHWRASFAQRREMSCWIICLLCGEISARLLWKKNWDYPLRCVYTRCVSQTLITGGGLHGKGLIYSRSSSSWCCLRRNLFSSLYAHNVLISKVIMREETKLMFEFHREISLVCHSSVLPKGKFASGGWNFQFRNMDV